jgi:uncharacterized protein (DUF1810 family)
VLTYLPYSDGGAATFLASGCIYIYGISSIADVKVILPILGHQSLVCVNGVYHWKVRLVFGKERLYWLSRSVTSLPLKTPASQ